MNQNIRAPQVITRVNSEINGRCRLRHLGVIKVEGDDAAKFLHGQLTQDFSLLGTDSARLAALCSPKGRVLASFIGFKCPDGKILLICSRDILESTLKRLSMFVLRAKVKLSDASSEFAIWGIAGTAATQMLPASAASWAKVDIESATLVQLYPAQGVQRVLCVSPVEGVAPDTDDLPSATWNWLEVQSGVATVSSTAVDKYVPQMLNYESVGGISFKKGCYPGQEVVARSQFRGTLKRRAFLVHCEKEMACGADVFLDAPDTESVATIVQTAASALGGFDAIASGNISALGERTLHLGAHDGPVLSTIPLPYTLLEDI